VLELTSLKPLVERVWGPAKVANAGLIWAI